MLNPKVKPPNIKSFSPSARSL